MCCQRMIPKKRKLRQRRPMSSDRRIPFSETIKYIVAATRLGLRHWTESVCPLIDGRLAHGFVGPKVLRVRHNSHDDYGVDDSRVARPSGWIDHKPGVRFSLAKEATFSLFLNCTIISC
jgi:hypothetical protein